MRINPIVSITKCFNKYPQGVPVPTTYAKFVLALKTGKKEKIASKARIPHKTLSPVSAFNITYKFLTAILNWFPRSS